MRARLFAVALLCAGVGMAHADDAGANSPGPLRAKYSALQDRLSHNQFQRPLHLDSSETPGSVTGGIYAMVNHPFATVGTALNRPGNWCDILNLHLNTKYCRATSGGEGSVLNVRIGKKYDQPLHEAYPVEFAYRVAAQTPNYLRVRLNADEGPLSTRDYRIVLEAVPLENGQTFIHLSYSYAYGLAGRLAMQAYLGTIGRTAPATGAVVSLASAHPAASVPSSVTVPAGASSANFVVNTSPVSSTTIGNITATYAGVSKSVTLTVNAAAPAALSALTLSPATVVGGSSSVGTVRLNKVTSSPVVIALTSNKPTKAIVPANVTVPAGASAVTFNITTATTNKKINASITASYIGVTKSATLTMIRR